MTFADSPLVLALRALARDPRTWLAAALLLPVVFFLPPIPIDETRYLAVAWEMRQSGEFLVPHLNGATYAHKPPLLFWLINLGWLFTGVHAWTARFMILLCALASLWLLHRLVVRLTGSAATAHTATWMLLGMLYFGAFANAIMFDVLLATWVLVAFHGVLDLVQSRGRRGVALIGGALGLGILTKGPVMLLDIAFVALLAPWWSGTALAGRRLRYFAALALSVLIGAAIGLAWAIPAAVHGGQEYADAIFMRQTFDRIQGKSGTSSHARPWWWYGMVFPLMILPWPLVLRGSVASARALVARMPMRFALAGSVPTLIAFSLIGGKQPHYLLPMLPLVALAFALLCEQAGWRLRHGLWAFAIVIGGLALAVLPHYVRAQGGHTMVAEASSLWGILVAAIGIALYAVRRIHTAVPATLAALACVLVAKIAVIHVTGLRYDPAPVAERIRAAQAAGQPVLHLGWHHGVYEFAGRLRDPVPATHDSEELRAWAQRHPDGLLVTFYDHWHFNAAPVYSQPFRGAHASIWRAQEALAAGLVRDRKSGTPIEPEETAED